MDKGVAGSSSALHNMSGLYRICSTGPWQSKAVARLARRTIASNAYLEEVLMCDFNHNAMAYNDFEYIRANTYTLSAFHQIPSDNDCEALDCVILSK